MSCVPDFKNTRGEWVRSYKIGAKQYWTQAGRIFGDMLKRADPDGRTQATRPTYIGCSTDFQDFNEFCEWCQKQVGYSDRFHLDKDLLVRGNKVYSRESCVFLPRVLNSLISKSDASRGALPIGVTYEESGKFRATLKSLGTGSYLGLFPTAEEAFKKYKTEKEAFIKQQANIWRDKIDERAYNALISYQVLITD